MVTKLLLVSLCVLTVRTHRILIDGDAFIEGMFMIRSQRGKECGELLAESAKYYLAAYWTIQSLNKQNYIPGVKLGFRLHETCGSPERASDIALNITSARDTTYNRTIAILGPESSAEADVVSRLFSALPGRYRPLQIGFSTTAASLSDKSLYKNFFRVIPSDIVQTKAMLKFIESLKWTYFAVFYQNDTYGREVLGALKRHKKTSQYPLCFPVETPVAPDNINASQLEAVLRSYGKHNPPIPGLVVIGEPDLLRELLKTIRNLQNHTKDYKTPVMLFTDGFPMNLVRNNAYANVTNGMYFLTPPLLDEVEMQKLTEHILQVDNIREIYDEFDDDFLESLHSSFTYTHYVIQAVLTIAKVSKIMSEKRNNNIWNIPKYYFINEMNNIKIDLGTFGQFRIDAFTQPALILSFPRGQADVVWGFHSQSHKTPSYSIRNKRSSKENSRDSCLKTIFEYFEKDDRSKLYKEYILDYQFAGNKWHEHKYPNIRIPQCPEGHMCSACAGNKANEVEVIPGSADGTDMYIVAIVQIHSESDMPFQCGDISKGGYDIVEAIKFMIDKIQRSKTRFKAKIGAIIIDTCNDPDRVHNKLADLFKNGLNVNGTIEKVDDKILGFVGGQVSDIALRVAEHLTRLKYIQISYATSTDLSDRQKYPYFMRVVRSDDDQAKVLLQIVKDMESNLVQILYSKTSYGISGKNAIIRYAAEFDICVTNTVGIKNKDLGNLTSVIEMLSFPGNPKIIIIFLSSFHVMNIIGALDSMKGYRFVASEEWGQRKFVSKAGGLNGTVTLAYELRMGGFKEHFEKIIPKLPGTNPWMEEYIQSVFNCSLEWSFDKTRRTCGHEDNFSSVCLQVEGSCYKIGTWAPFAMYATEALLRGSKKTLEQLCGTTLNICSEFRENPKRLIDNIRSLKFDYDGFSSRALFDANYDGLIDYNSYYIQISSETPEYVHMSDVEGELKWPWSTCNKIKNPKCDECFRKEPAKRNSALIGIITAIVLILLATCVVGFIFRVISRRKKRQINVKNTYSGVYMTPMEGSDGYALPSDVSDHRQTRQSEAGEKSARLASSFDEINQMQSQAAIRMSSTTIGDSTSADAEFCLGDSLHNLIANATI